MGILDGKTSGYFLTSEGSGYFRFISGYVLTSDIGNWSSGSQTSLTSFCRYIHFLSEFYFRSEFHFRFDVHTSTRLRSIVTGLPWRRPVLHQDGSRRVSDRFPGALGRNPTRRTDRCDLRYGLDQSPYRLPAISSKSLTDLGKFEQTSEART